MMRRRRNVEVCLVLLPLSSFSFFHESVNIREKEERNQKDSEARGRIERNTKPHQFQSTISPWERRASFGVFAV